MDTITPFKKNTNDNDNHEKEDAIANKDVVKSLALAKWNLATPAFPSSDPDNQMIVDQAIEDILFHDERSSAIAEVARHCRVHGHLESLEAIKSFFDLDLKQ